MNDLRSLLLVTVLLNPSQTYAGFTGFEDLASGDEFFVGETIQSEGLNIDVVEYLAPGGRAGIALSSGGLGLSGLVLSTGDLAFDLPIPIGTQLLSLDYSIDGFSGMFINGVEVPESLTFTTLDGTTVGGVHITVNALTPPIQEEGELILNGPISSFIIGGTEFAIDNVTIGIPEPSTALLMVASCALIMASSRRRR